MNKQKNAFLVFKWELVSTSSFELSQIYTLIWYKTRIISNYCNYFLTLHSSSTKLYLCNITSVLWHSATPSWFFYFCPTQTNLLCQLFVPTRSQKYSCVSRLCDNDSCNFVRLNKIFPFLSHLSHLSTNRQMSTKPRWSPRSQKKFKTVTPYFHSVRSGKNWVTRVHETNNYKLWTLSSHSILYTLHSPLSTANCLQSVTTNFFAQTVPPTSKH